MRILFAIKALSDTKGGAERVLTDISAGLADKGHNVAILSFDPPETKSFYKLNSKVHHIALGIGDVSRKASLFEVISRMIAIRKASKKFKPDVVVGFMHSTFIPASFAMIRTKVPLIASEHIVPLHYKNRRWEYILLLLSRFFVKKITVLSDTIIKSYPRFLHKKMVAIANPVNMAKQLADTRGEHLETKTILNVGRLTEQKDQIILIRAFASIAKEFPTWRVRIIGEGNLHEYLQKNINELNMRQKITLAGTTNKIENEYQSAQIFALPSRYESFGLATAEAMSHKLPVIGFKDCPGTNEIIEHKKNGWLVSGDDKVTEFANALKALMLGDDMRDKMGREGLSYVTRFHPSEIVNQWEKVIKEI